MIASLEQHHWSPEEDAVYDIHQGQQWPWDSDSAQVRCRNEQSWLDYERLVRMLMA